jgi:hypothetical protein
VITALKAGNPAILPRQAHLNCYDALISMSPTAGQLRLPWLRLSRFDLSIEETLKRHDPSTLEKIINSTPALKLPSLHEAHDHMRKHRRMSRTLCGWIFSGCSRIYGRSSNN